MGRREQFTVGRLDITEGIYVNGVNFAAAIDGVTASPAEINKLTGVTPGTVSANKAVVVGANKNVDVLAVADLKLGSGAGTSITATAAEINKLASSGAVVASGTASANIPSLKADYIKTDLDDGGAIDGTEIAAALCLTNAKINTIIALLEGFKMASAT